MCCWYLVPSNFLTLSAISLISPIAVFMFSTINHSLINNVLSVHCVPGTWGPLSTHDGHSQGSCLPHTISKPISRIQKVERRGKGCYARVLILNTQQQFYPPAWETDSNQTEQSFFPFMEESNKRVKCSSSSLLWEEEGQMEILFLPVLEPSMWDKREKSFSWY